jgi:hypothetical protein
MDPLRAKPRRGKELRNFSKPGRPLSGLFFELPGCSPPRRLAGLQRPCGDLVEFIVDRSTVLTKQQDVLSHHRDNRHSARVPNYVEARGVAILQVDPSLNEPKDATLIDNGFFTATDAWPNAEHGGGLSDGTIPDATFGEISSPHPQFLAKGSAGASN